MLYSKIYLKQNSVRRPEEKFQFTRILNKCEIKF